MARFIGRGPWWLFLTIAAMIVVRVFEDVALWGLILVAIFLAAIALLLMFWRDMKVWCVRFGWPPIYIDQPILTDDEAFRLSPGAGTLAAKLILKQTDITHAEQTLAVFKATNIKQDEMRPYAALIWKFAQKSNRMRMGEVMEAALETFNSMPHLDAAMQWVEETQRGEV